jgi:hypothetical protein
MCEHIKTGGGEFIVCGMRRRHCACNCRREIEFECDWKVPGKKSGTCDRPLCAVHAKEVAPNKHLCPEHQSAWDAWKRARLAAGFINPELPAGQISLFPHPLS